MANNTARNIRRTAEATPVPPAPKAAGELTITITDLPTATIPAEQIAAYLPLAASAAINAKRESDKAKADRACGLALVIASLSHDDNAQRKWSFTIEGNGSDQAHHFVACTGIDEHGGTEGAWRYNTEGATSRVAQTAYKNAVMATFYNTGSPAVWTMHSKAVPLVAAIRAEGMTASYTSGKLVLTGGDSDRAKAMREAKTLAALKKAVEGAAGTNRDKPQNDKGEAGEASDTRPATPEEILRAAAALVTTIAKGEEAVTNAALSFARAIAATVTKNKAAFAEA